MRELYKRADGCPVALPMAIGVEGLRHELAQRDQIIAEQCRDAELYKLLLDSAENQIEQLNRYIIQLKRDNERMVVAVNAAREVNETVKVLCG